MTAYPHFAADKGTRRRIEWLTPNRMRMETGHATFDRQTNIVAPGNIIANTLVGFHVRPFSEPMYPDGRTPAKPGQMQAFDLSMFVDMPGDIRRRVESLTTTEGAWLYRVSHATPSYDRSGYRRRITHGWILTRVHGGRVLAIIQTNRTLKSEEVLRVVAEYLA